jgi:hypothetical protein
MRIPSRLPSVDDVAWPAARRKQEHVDLRGCRRFAGGCARPRWRALSTNGTVHPRRAVKPISPREVFTRRASGAPPVKPLPQRGEALALAAAPVDDLAIL